MKQGLTHSLLALILAGAAALATADSWREGRHYAPGDVVFYQGQQYRAIQGHDAHRGANWNPRDAASLWQPVGRQHSGRYDDGQYHPNPRYDDGQYHPDPRYDDGRWRPDVRSDDWRRRHWENNGRRRPDGWRDGHRYGGGEWVWYRGRAYEARRPVNEAELWMNPLQVPGLWLDITATLR
ncbi:carbohydrate-binding protein [Jeongeupia naejangsanensis]|uniref:Chitin-binding type-3 domain-containing protein n=1 Tax=Jeongeupia naejangsanensis TaxID=613195 RepID=A0ABS2BN74_9NEIS|nr:carbohydrate-binding protein [Jeongeupia naejangsanensis]MBM3117067.1 hypothetical protein [Jeongeupia naejangsanensis]